MAQIRTSLLAVYVLVAFVAGCGSGGGEPAPETSPTQQLAGLPGIPQGEADVRQGSITSSDLVQGADYFDDRGAVVDGTGGIVAAGVTPADNISYAIYQHVARPDPAEPYMLNVIGSYQDTDPVDVDPAEGYYLGFADYSLGRWVFTGPHKTASTRHIYTDPQAVASPAGFIYTAVITYQGNTVKVASVEVGYYLGLGYEQYVLPEVVGESAGQFCDIEIDSAGNPQIAYLVAPSMFSTEEGHIRVARHVADEWVVQDVDPGFPVRYIDFATGSEGRRGIVMVDRPNSHIHLMLDLGTGVFSTYDLIEPNSNNANPTITYVNGADDPLGLLDTALVVYGKSSGALIQTSFFETDGVVTAAGNIAAVGSTRPDGLMVTTTGDKYGLVAVPEDPGPDIDCTFYRYSAVTDTWALALTIAPWLDLDIYDPMDDKWIVLRELPDGNLVAGYRSDRSATYNFGLYNGLTWESLPDDSVSCMEGMNRLDFEVYSDNSIGFATQYGTWSPVNYRGTVGSSVPFVPEYMSLDHFSCSEITMAVGADDVAHFALNRPFDGQVTYQSSDAGVLSDLEVLDYGAGGAGSTYGPAVVTGNGDHLYVFHNDTAHGKVLFSHNYQGVWEVEQMPIPESEGIPYVVFQAGMLETTNEVYVSYVNFMNYSWMLLIGDQNGTSWRAVESAPFSEIAFVEDDENHISVAYYGYGIDGEPALYFVHEVDVNGSSARELVTQDIEIAYFPISLAYNPFNSSWDIAANTDGAPRCNLFHRAAPGSWQGPYLVAQVVDGPSARSEAFGITHRVADGRIMVGVRQREAGSDITSINVVTSAPGPIAFDSTDTVASIDATLEDFNGSQLAATSTGEAAVCVVKKLIADATWDVDLYTPQWFGWNLVITWDSPIVQPSSMMGYSLAVVGDYLPAVTLTEDDDTQPLYKRGIVYYPW